LAVSLPVADALGDREPEEERLGECVLLTHRDAELEPVRQRVTLRDPEPDAEGHCEGERVRVGVKLRDPVAHLEVLGEGEIVAEALGDEEAVA
jgi:hypothetical protein